MDEQHGRHPEDDADDLLRRALIDPDASVAVALKVKGLALADALTVVFHGRADLGTIQTYVAHGPLGAGAAVAADALLRVPCDLDLGDAESRDEAEEADWPKVIAAAAVQGVTFRVTRATVDRLGAQGFRYFTGVWPGEKHQEQSQAAEAIR